MASTSSKRTPYGAPEAPVIARMTGSLVIARAGSVRGNVSGAPADAEAGENAECGVRNAEWTSARLAACRPSHRASTPSFSIPHSAFRHPQLSEHPIRQRAKKDHDAHDPIGREKRGVEAAQVSRLHEVVLPGDEPGADRDAPEVCPAEARARPEQHEIGRAHV